MLTQPELVSPKLLYDNYNSPPRSKYVIRRQLCLYPTKKIMKLVSRAWLLQHRIENCLRGKLVFTLEGYLFSCCFVLFILGFGLFIYCLLVGVHPLSVVWTSCPLHYLGLGFLCLVGYLWVRKSNSVG